MKKDSDALNLPYIQLDQNISYDSNTVDDIDGKILIEKLYEMIETLTDREQFIVKSNYIECVQLKKIGKEMGISGERVGQILNKALRKLRHPSRSYPLRYVKDHMSIFDIEEEKEQRKRELEEIKERQRLDQERRLIEWEERRNARPSYLKLELDSRGKRCIVINRRDWNRTTHEIAKSWLDQLIAIEDKTPCKL